MLAAGATRTLASPWHPIRARRGMMTNVLADTDLCQVRLFKQADHSSYMRGAYTTRTVVGHEGRTTAPNARVSFSTCPMIHNHRRPLQSHEIRAATCRYPASYPSASHHDAPPGVQPTCSLRLHA